jgi:HSP20 family protein
MLKKYDNKMLEDFVQDFWNIPNRTRVAGANFANTVGTMDVSEDDKNFYVEIDVPNYDIEDIRIEVQNKKMIITGAIEAEKSDRKYRIRERNYNSFTRTILFENTIDEENIAAELENGVLNIVVVKRCGDNEKKKIQIKKI